ncbi:conserved hypothetical protein [Streptomyces sp. C]|nr:conserved hypothetical protein [Streptomyces sp. C]
MVPQDGLPAWEAPDVSRPTAALDPFLPVRLLSRRGEWGEILCANGWSAWVDGRLLVAVPQPPPTTGRPLERTEDPEPLLTRTADTLDRYRRALRETVPGAAGDGFPGRPYGALRAGSSSTVSPCGCTRRRRDGGCTPTAAARPPTRSSRNREPPPEPEPEPEPEPRARSPARRTPAHGPAYRRHRTIPRASPTAPTGRGSP